MSTRSEIAATVRTLPIDRAIPNGLDVNDFVELTRAFEAGGNYAEICDRLGDQARSYADGAAALGHGATARDFYLRATAAYRVGQYTIVPDNDQKIGMYRKLVECYSAAAALFDPPISRFDVPYRGAALSGWLRLPVRPSAKRLPLVISIGGADGWREEHHNYSSFYADRGIAYLMIDGPGQGETRIFNKLHMTLDNEEALAAVVARAAADGRFGKIGMIGYSFGGYLVARTAAVCPRLDAVVVNGGSYRPAEIMKTIPHFANVFSALSGKNGADLEAFIAGMTLEGYAERISCALLVNHGIPDPLFNVDGLRRLYEEAPAERKRLMLWPDGNHCVTNHYLETTTMFADFFADTLGE